MKDQAKTKAQLIAELESMRGRVAELETRDSDTHSVLEAVIQQSPIPMAIATPSGELRSFNQACAEHLGFDDDPLLESGTRLSEFKRTWTHYDPSGAPVSPEDLPLALAFRGEATHNREFRVVRKDGSERWQLASAVPVYTDDGELIAAVVAFPDITAFKRSEERLARSRAALAEAQQIARLGSWELDLATGRPIWSDQMFDVLGMKTGTVPDSEAVRSLIVPDDVAVFDDASEKLADGIVYDSIEYRIKRPDGQLRHLLAQARGVFDSSGSLTRVAGTLQDVTDQKAHEANLNEAQRIARTGHWIWKPAVGDLNWSDEMRRIFGEPPNFAPSYESFLTAFHADDKKAVEQAIADALADIPFEVDARILTPAGEVRTVHLKGEATFDDERRPTLMRGTATDITARTNAEAALRASRQSLSEAQATARLGSWSHDLETDAVHWSDELFRIMGIERQEVTLELFMDRIHPDDRAQVLEAIKRGEEGDSTPWEFRIVRPDGAVRHILSRKSSETDGAGKELRVFGTLQDVTGRKHAEEGLLELGLMVDTSLDLMAFVDQNCTYLASNPAYLRAFDLAPGELVGLTMADVLGTRYFDEVVKPDAERCLAGEHTLHDAWVEFPTMGRRYMTVSYHPYRGGRKDGPITGFVLTGRDITEEIRSRTLLSDQRELLELISGDQASHVEILEQITRTAEEHVADVRASILLRDGEAIRHGAAPSMPDAYNALLDGLSIGPAVGSCGTAMYREELVIVEDVRSDPLWADYRDLGETYGFRACWSQPILGSTGDVLGSFALYRKEPGAPNDREVQLIESMANLAGITLQRKRRETELRKLSAAIEQSPALVMITDRDGTIEYVNRKFCEVTGYSIDEILGQTPRVLKGEEMPETFYSDLWQTVLSGQEWRGEFLNKKKNGELYWEGGTISSIRDENGEISHLLSVKEETTERKALEAENEELERRVRRSQKLDTIGTLAGGIAHDFNNILTPIMGYAEIAEDRTDPSDPLHADLERILGAAQRAKELIDRILLFSRQTEKERRPVGIPAIADEAIQLLRSSIPATIAIDAQIDPSCGLVFADETQVHEVIVNLCTNAYHAMEGGTGTLTIRVEPIALDTQAARMSLGLDETDYVRISVRDTGSGMDADLQGRIFEPFFTTKSVGKGTGMGLSVVHGIVQSHHGEVVVQSTPGEGTVFDVYLPVTTEEAHLLPEDSRGAKKGQESILVLDDDPAIADVVTAMVEQLGYEVKTYTSSPTALEALTLHPERFDLVVSDLTMPDLTGRDLSGRLASFDPPIPILIMTGYGDELERDEGYMPRIVAKPFALQELAGAIRELLDA